MKIGIIGLGRMGFVQARLGRYMGDTLLWGCDNSIESAKEFQNEFNVPVYTQLEEINFSQCDVIWLTVNDDNIETCASRLSHQQLHNTIIFHTSGVHNSTILKNHLHHHSCASYHPLMACPPKNCSDQDCATAYAGVIHTVEGDKTAIDTAQQLIERLGAKFVHINSEDKALYHAAAVFASNYPLTLLDIAVQLFIKCGFNEQCAMEACKLMIEQLTKSLHNHSIQEALTGPIKRNDVNTIYKHQMALQNNPEYLEVYNQLKRATEKMLQR